MGRCAWRGRILRATLMPWMCSGMLCFAYRVEIPDVVMLKWTSEMTTVGKGNCRGFSWGFRGPP